MANMSMRANPLLYLNMGGEMLYVLRQRLKAQKISIDKTIRVMNEVTANLLDPNAISKLFQQSGPINIPAIRSMLEKVVLSSIMRLDQTSMDKLFHLIIMMVKYQIQMATGPREILLVTLNHMDSMRETLVDSIQQESIILVHGMLLRIYGDFTYEQMWQLRQACLISLDGYNTRVSILLKLNVQRENGTFVPSNNPAYNERYEDRREHLWNLRLLENSCKQCNVGSLQFVGDRVTILGCNLYSDLKKMENTLVDDGKRRLSKYSDDTKAELGMLAVQLGNNEDDSISSSQGQCTPFTLQLFTDNSDMGQTTRSIESTEKTDPVGATDLCEDESAVTVESTSNYRYKTQLDNIYTDLIVEEDIKDTIAVRTAELLHLMDQLE